MKSQTDQAILAMLQGLDFGSLTPTITLGYGSHVVDDSEDTVDDWDKTFITLARFGDIQPDHNRLRPGDVIRLARLDNNDIVLVDYPEPFDLFYQIDIMSSQNPDNDKEAEVEALEQVVLDRFSVYGFSTTGTWNLTLDDDTYPWTMDLEGYHSDNPATMVNEDNDGERRTVIRIGVKTWRFGQPRLVKSIQYRIIQIQASDSDNKLILNPDEYGG